MEDYRIQLPFFSGPFDLLLELVKANEMDVSDVTIFEIIGQYLSFVELAKLCDLELAGEFLDLASTLIRIKSRALLPESPFDKEEEEEDLEEEISEIQSARQLIDQLIEYRKYKELSLVLGEKEEENTKIFYRSKIKAMDQKSEPDELTYDTSLLLKALARNLKYIENLPSHTINKEIWTTEGKMAEIDTRLDESGHVNITKLFQNCVHKVEVITVLLAILEMCKQKLIEIRQEENFEEINIYRSQEQLDYVGSEPDEE